MNSVQAVLAWLHGVIASLHGPVNSLFAFIGDVAANRPVPADRAVLYTLVPLVLAWAVLRVRKVSK